MDKQDALTPIQNLGFLISAIRCGVEFDEHCQRAADALRAHLTNPGYVRVPEGVHIKRDGDDIRIACGDLEPDGRVRLGDAKARAVWVGPNPQDAEMAVLYKLADALLAAAGDTQ